VVCGAISVSNLKQERITMKYLKCNQSSRMLCVLLSISLMSLGGCAEWSSTPARVQADYGKSVLSQVNNQIYNPEKAQHPAALLPDGMEGNKADRVLEKTYRDWGLSNQKMIQHSPIGMTQGTSTSVSTPTQ
jgi:hypothetical protein